MNKKSRASSTGKYLNMGNGLCLNYIDLGHPDYIGVIEPDSAFWSLVRKDQLGEVISENSIVDKLNIHLKDMNKEIETLRFKLKPSAVYFNPTEQCNLNCPYCYIPSSMRKKGRHMTWEKIDEAFQILKGYFEESLPKRRKPQIVFHGSEPLMNKDAVFRAIETYGKDFSFGVQTNGTLLEQKDFDFLSSNNVMIGLSIDGPTEEISDQTRKNWSNTGTFKKLLKTLEICKGYPLLSVICTVTKHNVKSLIEIVDFFHAHYVANCLINQVRCTLEGGRQVKPSDSEMAEMFIKALGRTHELFKQTGRKLIVANFANILLGIVAPSARRLMCDINPCGGGRCFFAVSAKGDVFPCSEFIGLKSFKGGNLFKDDLNKILNSTPFQMVTKRKIEDIKPCNKCAIRHFCGSPCPAEAFEINGDMANPGAFCEFYEEQVRYAFRLIADGKENDYLWDNWDNGTSEVFRF
jgi:uncharacterized protein